MRTRYSIEQDGTRKDILALEVLLDIRDILEKTPKRRQRRKQGVHYDPGTGDHYDKDAYKEKKGSV